MADALWSSVLVLSHLDETDGSAINLGNTPGSVTINAFSTTTKKFGAASILGEVDYAKTGGIPSTDLAGDFTNECWFWWDASDTDCTILQMSDDDGAFLVRVFASGAVDLFSSFAGTSVVSAGAGTLSANAWHHVVLQQTSGTLKLCLDGASLGTATGSTTFTDTVFSWGVWTNFEANFIDEIRVTKASRYTTPFTPPTAAFDSTGGGALGEGDGSAAGTSTLTATGAIRSAGVASSAGVGAAAAAAIDKTPRGDASSVGASTASAGIANAAQTNGWSQINFWPPFGAWALSTDNKTATLAPTALYDEVRGVNGKSTGKWYFEVSTGAVSSKGVGITQTGVALGVGPPPVRQSSGFTSTWGFAFDADTREYWYRFDGTWVAGGPGVAAADGTLLPGTQVPYADQSASSGSGQTFVARFTAADLLSAVPAGFTAIDDIPGNVGAAVGTSTAVALGASGQAGAGASTGVATAAAGGVQGRVGVGATAGTSTAAALGVPATARDGTASGTSTSAGAAKSTARGTAAAAGSAASSFKFFSQLVATAAGVSAAAANAGGRVKFGVGPTVTTKPSALTALTASSGISVRGEVVTLFATTTPSAQPATIQPTAVFARTAPNSPP